MECVHPCSVFLWSHSNVFLLDCSLITSKTHTLTYNCTWHQVMLLVGALLDLLKVLVAPLFSTLCDLMDCNPPGSSVHWLLQARILRWVAIPFFNRYFQPRDWTRLSSIAGGLYLLSHQGMPGPTEAIPVCSSPTTIHIKCLHSSKLPYSRRESFFFFPLCMNTCGRDAIGCSSYSHSLGQNSLVIVEKTLLSNIIITVVSLLIERVKIWNDFFKDILFKLFIQT